MSILNPQGLQKFQADELYGKVKTVNGVAPNPEGNVDLPDSAPAEHTHTFDEIPGLEEQIDAIEASALGYVATYATGDFNSLDFSRIGTYRVRGGTGYVANSPATTAGVWYNVTVLQLPNAADTNSQLYVATSNNSSNVWMRVKYGTGPTWGSWVAVTTTYSSMTVAEGTAGTATTGRTMRADYLKQIINYFITGNSGTQASVFGQSLITAANAPAARETLGAAADSHAHGISDVTGLQAALNDRVEKYNGAVANAFLFMSTESGKAVSIPYFMNDIAYNNLRGGSTKLLVDGVESATSLDICFEPTSQARSLPVTPNEYVVEINTWKTFTYGTKVGFAAMESWRARYMKIEAQNAVTGAWITCFEDSAFPGGDMIASVPGNSNQGINKLRYTFRDFASSSFRIGNLFLINYSSEMGAAYFLPRGGGELYGNVRLLATPSTSEHLVRKDYVDNQVGGRVANSVLAASGKGYVNHGSNASTARPTGYASVEWVGTIAPTNATAADTWVDIS